MESLSPVSYSLHTIQDVAKIFREYLNSYRVFTFSGDLGAGKTTFIHALCDELGVQDNVSSPTYALMNEYHFADAGRDRIICHMDWYRLRDEEEATDAGMEDSLLNADTICFVEWPEKAAGLLNMAYLSVSIEITGEQTRTMHLTSH